MPLSQLSGIPLGLSAGESSGPRGRVLLTIATLGTVAAAPAGATDNPWLERRVMNMAHSGGEDEAPMNTMYAFKRAAALGADMIELDVQSTADAQLVVIHNATVDETTNGTGRVVDLTLEQVQSLDAAYWFVPGRSAVHGLPDDAYVLRGARYGRPKVAGYQPKDFRVPTLREVLREFHFLYGMRPIDGTVALQVPVTYAGIPVATKEFVARAHGDGYAVHVWFSGSAPHDAPTYNSMIDTCADGIMAAKPTLLESILDERGIERPGQPGVDPCA